MNNKEKERMKKYESCQKSGESQTPPLTARRMRTLAPRIKGAKWLETRGQGEWQIPVGFKVPAAWRLMGRPPKK